RGGDDASVLTWTRQRSDRRWPAPSHPLDAGKLIAAHDGESHPVGIPRQFRTQVDSSLPCPRKGKAFGPPSAMARSHAVFWLRRHAAHRTSREFPASSSAWVSPPTRSCHSRDLRPVRFLSEPEARQSQKLFAPSGLRDNHTAHAGFAQGPSV